MSRELRADPGVAPGERNRRGAPSRSIWPSIAVVAAAAAFGGVIWFAYQNAREGTRSGPPVVEADTSPVKIKPDNPGGEKLPFQDSTVYDRLDPKGQKPKVEKLLPPPETPMVRDDADATADAPANPPDAPPAATPSTSTAADVPSPPASTKTATLSSVLTQAMASPAPGPDPASPTVLAPPPGAMVTPPPPPPHRAPAVAPPKPAPSASSSAGAAAGSPTTIAELEQRVLAGGAGNPAAQKPAPAAAGGGYRIQISAVTSEAAVAPEWARLKRRFPEILSPLTLSSSKAEVPGKGVVIRLRAGPLDRSGATAACDRLRAQGLGCVVVKP